MGAIPQEGPCCECSSQRTWLMTVKPTEASEGRPWGKSCIMHSSRVLSSKAVRLSSLYLGFTNSAMTPCVASSAAR